MRRRRLLLGVLAVWAVLLAGMGAGLALLLPEDPITPEAAARIREGMTEEEVEQLLGGRKATLSLDGREVGSLGNSRGKASLWVGEKGFIAVGFADDERSGCRVDRSAEFIPEKPPPFLSRLRRLLSW
jgi:hypothetical protein